MSQAGSMVLAHSGKGRNILDVLKVKLPLSGQFFINVNLFVYFIYSNAIQFFFLLWTSAVNGAVITRLPFQDQS